MFVGCARHVAAKSDDSLTRATVARGKENSNSRVKVFAFFLAQVKTYSCLSTRHSCIVSNLVGDHPSSSPPSYYPEPCFLSCSGSSVG